MLLTIRDLGLLSPDALPSYVANAQVLTSLWHQWKANHEGNMDVPVEFRGERGRKAGIHASELSGCMRKLVYAARGTPRVVLPQQKDVAMQRRFDVGTMVHALLQKEFHLLCDWINQQNGRKVITFEEEVSIHPGLGGVAAELDLHSSMDGLFTFYHPMWNEEANAYVDTPYMRVGLEIKTKSNDEFKKLKEPDNDHKEQTCLYMAALDVPLMWVLYYNKSSSVMTTSEAPYLFKYNQEMWEKLLRRRIQEAHAAAKANTLPERTEGMPCGWCPFAHECKPNRLNTGQSYKAVSSKGL